jgi:hypothetical protein
MKKLSKVAAGGLASVTMMAGLVMTPLASPAGAMSLESVKEPQKNLKLNAQSNNEVDVETELNCSTHTLTAKVTNKTAAAIHPNVTFNEEESNVPGSFPIEPGMTGNYYYDFSGNNLLVDVVVQGDSFGTVETSPTLNCLEPVSFEVTDWSDSAVIGELRNNSTIVPQTVYTQVGSGDVRLETLEPGEMRTIALPFKGFPEQSIAMVKIATSAGYESSYMVDLDKIQIPELPPVPLHR